MIRNLCIAFNLVMGFTLLSGCAYLDSIYREPVLSDNQSMLTDAKQRVVTNTPVKPKAQTYMGRIDPQRVLCAEPSPDVAQAISAALSIAVSKGEASGNMGTAVSEGIAQLGERLGSIQLLRDKMYRACEAYANGAISATTYTIMMSRLDKTMTTLMLSEMSAGAFGRGLASIGGAAQASANRDEKLVEEAQKAVDEAKKEVEKKQTALKDAETALAADPNNTVKQGAKSRAEQELKDAKEDLAKKEKALASITQRAFASASASSTPTGGIGIIGGRSGAPTDALAHQVTILQRQYLEAEDTSTLLDACISAMDLLRRPTLSEAASIVELSKQINLLDEGIKKNDSSRNALVAQKKQKTDELNEILDNMDPSRLGRYCRDTGMGDITKMINEQQLIRMARVQADVMIAQVDLCKAVIGEAQKTVDEARKEVGKKETALKEAETALAADPNNTVKQNAKSRADQELKNAREDLTKKEKDSLQYAQCVAQVIPKTKTTP